jgi:hypothetical protein
MSTRLHPGTQIIYSPKGAGPQFSRFGARPGVVISCSPQGANVRFWELDNAIPLKKFHSYTATFVPWTAVIVADSVPQFWVVDLLPNLPPPPVPKRRKSRAAAFLRVFTRKNE